MDLPLHRTAGRISLAIFALAGAGLIAFGASQASASHVSCGDTITADTTLDSDLVDCPNNGIVIGADDITLDLNGHLIDGDGTLFAGCGKDELCDVGVANDGHDGVTVRHGSVREFDSGVLVGSSTSRKVRHNRVGDISSSKNLSFGFVLAGAARSLVRNSSGHHNVAPEGDGMGVFGCRHVRILHNKFRHNPGPGIHLDFDSSDNLIKRNRFSRNGISLFVGGDEGGDHNRVKRNRFRGGREDGILVGPGNGNVIARNHLTQGGNILVENGRGNLVARNVVAGARHAGILLGLPNFPVGGANNVVRRNLVKGSRGQGFLVTEDKDHTLLRNNVAVRAGDDGFAIRSKTTTLIDNRAVRNAELGINAVLGVIDGGGNKAHGNGNPAQCTNIACN
jgi:nitrous oxidase accessory protein NosD